MKASTQNSFQPLRARFGLSAALALAAFAPGLALAHPGHDGGFLHGLLHPFHGFDHLLAAIAVGIWGAKIGGKAAWALPAAFVGAMLAGGALGFAGIGLPLSEVLVAASVAMLGLAITTSARFAAPVGAAVVGIFAVFHGGAHGMEGSAASSFAAYGIGIVLATLALHMSGVAAGLALRARPLVLKIAAAPIAFAGLAMLVNRLQ